LECRLKAGWASQPAFLVHPPKARGHEQETRADANGVVPQTLREAKSREVSANLI